MQIGFANGRTSSECFASEPRDNSKFSLNYIPHISTSRNYNAKKTLVIILHERKTGKYILKLLPDVKAETCVQILALTKLMIDH